MNINSIRRRFPFLKRKYHGQPLAYLDNASTTQKPQVVIDAISDAYQNHYANIHRGVYDLSVEATDLYEGVRKKVAKFINASSEKEIIFTRNATEAINLLAYVQGESLHGGDEILLSQMEHHSNIVPFQLLAERLKTNDKRIKISYIPINKEGRLDLSTLDRLVTKRTKIVSLALMSNVLGTINPLKKIALVVRRLAPKAIIIVDAAQAIGHMRIDVGDLGCDFLAFSAHKMYGPSGVGVLWGKKELLEQMPPFMGGGDMILAVDFEKTTFNELPWKFEAGTPNIADVVAYGAALDFIQSIGFAKIHAHEMRLIKYALEKLSNYPTIQLYGPQDLADRGPVISFNVDDVHPHDVASILSEEAVAIRSGHHCAQPLMSVLEIGAAVRASFGIYNTEEEIQRLIKGIERVKGVFRLTTNAKRPTQISKSVSPSTLDFSHS
ncbi:cysteine desulfurase [Candidatus Curtissbacteria bacterium]|nr:cysteine desulfurase [Candidatus Curtissbacteria bacterium]